MAQDKRAGWLAELVVGDKVLVDTSICLVTGISPTGRITVTYGKGEKHFNAVGRPMGAGSWDSPLRRWTPEADADIKERAKRKKMLNILYSTRFDGLSTDRLEKLAAIVSDPQPGEGARE